MFFSSLSNKILENFRLEFSIKREFLRIKNLRILFFVYSIFNFFKLKKSNDILVLSNVL